MSLRRQEPGGVGKGRGIPPDTNPFSRRSDRRYRALMVVADIHRNQNTANPHAAAHASPIVGGMLRIDEQTRLGNQQGGWGSSLNKKMDL